MCRTLRRCPKTTWTLATHLLTCPTLVLAGGNRGMVAWLLGVAVLCPLWLASRPGRDCPRCGVEVKRGFKICAWCGFDLFPALPARGGWMRRYSR
jgi:hypothetical protein